MGLFTEGAEYKLEYFRFGQASVYPNLAFSNELAKLEAKYSNMDSQVVLPIFTITSVLWYCINFA